VSLEHPRDPLSSEFMRLRSECVHWLQPSSSAARAAGDAKQTADMGRDVLADPQV
jgi:hypothetical protein